MTRKLNKQETKSETGTIQFQASGNVVKNRGYLSGLMHVWISLLIFGYGGYRSIDD